MTDEPMTPAEHILVAALCQFYNPYPGPKTWLCRYAWLTYYQRQPLDVDQLIAEHADWLNRPENANTRTNLVNCIDHLRQLAAKPPLWPVPDVPPLDVSEWLDVGAIDQPALEVQATSSFGYWDGGAPGVGTFQQSGQCSEHHEQGPDLQ